MDEHNKESGAILNVVEAPRLPFRAGVLCVNLLERQENKMYPFVSFRQSSAETGYGWPDSKKTSAWIYESLMLEDGIRRVQIDKVKQVQLSVFDPNAIKNLDYGFLSESVPTP